MLSIEGDNTNMRSGPGTEYGVLDTLPQGTEAEVLEVDPATRTLVDEKIGSMLPARWR